MRLKLIAIVCGSSIGVMSARGGETYRYSRTHSGERVFEQIRGENMWPQRGTRAYDNWRDSTQGGNSGFRGVLRIGLDEFADDLQLIPVGNLELSDMAWSVYNTSATGTLTSYRATQRFYDSNLNLLGLDTYVYTITMGPRDGVLFFSDGGFFRPYHIRTPQNMFMSIQFSEVTGIDANDIATMYSGPRTSGYSTQYIRNLSLGQVLDIDGTDETNLTFFIDTVNIPAPSACFLSCSLLPLIMRRRRVTG